MQPSQQNPNKLYCGNLPFTMRDDDLNQLFAEFGEIVEAKVITDRESGRSKGFGFVEFTTAESAEAAIQALNESEVDGRSIFVKVARPKQPRENNFGGGNRSYDRNNDRRPRR